MDDIDVPATLLALKPGDERQAAFEADPTLWEQLLSYVETRFTFSTVCRTWGLPWPRLWRWAHATPERTKRLAEAEALRSAAIVDRIDNELQAIAFSDLRLCFTEAGDLKPITEWPDKIAAAVAGIDVQEMFAQVKGERQLEGYLRKLKLWDKPGAAKMLGQMHGQFTTKVDQKVTVTMDQVLETVWAERERDAPK